VKTEPLPRSWRTMTVSPNVVTSVKPSATLFWSFDSGCQIEGWQRPTLLLFLKASFLEQMSAGDGDALGENPDLGCPRSADGDARRCSIPVLHLILE
jgi:hypothetical protein